MNPDELSPGAILFVFGDRAADGDLGADSKQAEHEIPARSGYIHVPSGREMLAAYLAPLLLSVGVWRLREEGLVELGDAPGPVGRCRFEVVADGARPSIDGKMLETARGGEKKLKRFALGGSRGEPGSLVWTVAEIKMASHSDPYSAFCRAWRGEAVDAGAIKLKGLPGRRRPQADPGALARLDPRFAKLIRGWIEFKSGEPELAEAIRADAVAGIAQHYSEQTSG